MTASEPCPGCGVALPHFDGPVHAYIGASAACWAQYGRLLAREYEDPAYFRAHQDSVDAYAAQHPGLDGRRQRQSVAVHLLTLCLSLEQGWPPSRLPEARRRVIAVVDDLPWLEPPPAGPHELSATDVLNATDAGTHVALAGRWADSVWHRWSPHHDTVRGWIARVR